MRFKPLFKVTLVLSLVISGWLLFSPQKALALTGYFTGKNYGGGGLHLISSDYGSPNLGNVNDVDSFVSVISSCLNGGPCGSKNGPVAASYIILTMLGDGNHSVNEARTQFGNWEGKVRAYAAAGRLNFNAVDTYTINTMMVSRGNPEDVVSYPETITTNSIVFSNPDGTKYAIKKDCANPVGNESPLQNLTSVQGYIVDEATGAHIPGTVTVDVTSTHTDGSLYNIPMGGGNHSISATTDDGSYTITHWVQDSSDHPGAGGTFSISDGQTINVWFYAHRPTSTLQGRVVDPSGNTLDPNVIGGIVSLGGVGDTQNPATRLSPSDPAYIFANFGSGAHDFTMSLTASSTYTIVGFQLCAGNGCDPTALPIQPASGFPGYNFLPDTTYNSRWIVEPGATVSCGGAIVTPATIGPNTTYTVNATVNVSSVSQTNTVKNNSPFYINVFGPGVNYNDNNAPVSVNGTSLIGSATPGPTRQMGTYAISYGLAGAHPINCPAVTFIVAQYPYVSVLGGDVSAGAGFGSSCTPDPTAAIKTKNLGSPSFRGSGAQLAAFAMASITDFATGTQPNSGANVATDAGGGALSQSGALAFSNTNASSLGNFGNIGCVVDYADLAFSEGVDHTVDDTTSSVDISTLTSGVYAYNNSSDGAPMLDLHASSPIPANKKITIITARDTVLTSNILYGAYSGLENAPNVTIIVTNGSTLHIAAAVTQLNGFYVSQPDGAGTGGIISTCSVSVAGVWTPSISAADCSSVLTINGAVSAAKIQLNRTAGDLNGAPAEVIQFSPELWAGGLLDCGNTLGSCATTDDYVTSLAPIL